MDNRSQNRTHTKQTDIRYAGMGGRRKNKELEIFEDVGFRLQVSGLKVVHRVSQTAI